MIPGRVSASSTLVIDEPILYLHERLFRFIEPVHRGFSGQLPPLWLSNLTSGAYESICSNIKIQQHVRVL